MVLKFIEQDPIYCALLHDTLAELKSLVKPVTGPMLKMEGFIFISSPGAVTPFHFDPEHNILLQLRGSKTMTIFRAGDEKIARGELHEAFHMGGHRNLPWQDDLAASGTAFELHPGEAIYVPVKAPHWVKNGGEPSISFSITWRSEWSYREEQAHGLNRLLRQAGLNPAPPARFPNQNLLKSVAYRALAKAGRAVKGIRA
jgi:quercetin dioxygenase-like cupin family protein